MGLVLTILTIFLVPLGLFLILVILLQESKSGGLSGAFGGGGIVSIIFSKIVLVSGLTILVAADTLASAVVTHRVQEILARQNLPTLPTEISLTSFLGVYLESPGGEPLPLTIQEGAMINRNHIVVQAASIPVAIAC